MDNAAIGKLTPLLLLLEPTFLAAMILPSGLIAAVMVVEWYEVVRYMRKSRYLLQAYLRSLLIVLFYIHTAPVSSN